jgi:hypothetical protein
MGRIYIGNLLAFKSEGQRGIFNQLSVGVIGSKSMMNYFDLADG